MTSTPATAARKERGDGKSRWRVFFVAWLVLSALAAAWAVSTPVGAAPDEPAHLIKAAAVVRGEFIGTNDNSPNGQKVNVPAYIAYTPTQTCYAYNERATANCSKPLAGGEGKIVASATTAGLYNPIYYALVGWPSLLFHDDSGVYAMRIASGILASFFLALTVMFISTWRRRLIPMIGFAVATTPMVFFMNGVVNPNSLETTATLAAFTGVLSIVARKDDSLLVERVLLVVISAVLAVNARGLSPLWVALALLAPFLLASWTQVRELARRTAVKVAVAVIVAGAAVAIAWILHANSTVVGTASPTTAFQIATGVGSSPLSGFKEILLGTFDYGQGMIGVFGWLDTAAPSLVFFVWSAFIGGLFLVALVVSRSRGLRFTVVTGAALVLLPALVQAAYIHSGGIIWQGRYGLPLFVCVVVGWAAVVDDRFPEIDEIIGRRLQLSVLITWSISEAYSAAFALKRYSVGAHGKGTAWGRVFSDPAWSPPGGILVSLVFIVVAVLAVAVFFYRLANPSPGLRRAALGSTSLP
jgi:hypothetical protein